MPEEERDEVGENDPETEDCDFVNFCEDEKEAGTGEQVFSFEMAGHVFFPVSLLRKLFPDALS